MLNLDPAEIPESERKSLNFRILPLKRYRASDEPQYSEPITALDHCIFFWSISAASDIEMLTPVQPQHNGFWVQHFRMLAVITVRFWFQCFRTNNQMRTTDWQKIVEKSKRITRPTAGLSRPTCTGFASRPHHGLRATVSCCMCANDASAGVCTRRVALLPDRQQGDSGGVVTGLTVSVMCSDTQMAADTTQIDSVLSHPLSLGLLLLPSSKSSPVCAPSFSAASTHKKYHRRSIFL